MDKKDKNFKVLLAGCGELGSRHLQAVAALPEAALVEIVDADPRALERAKQRLLEIGQAPSASRFRWLTRLEEARAGGDLCIVATQAEGRCALVRRIAESFGYSSFILEKLVAPSIAEYEELLRFCGRKRLKVWVNCKIRAYEFHRKIKSMLDSSEPVSLSVAAGNYGLVTGGIHFADLFSFYDGGSEIECAGASVDPDPHPSKRGKNLFDLSGSLSGFSRKGSRLSIIFAADHMSPDTTVIATKRRRWLVDHLQGFAFQSGAESGWKWEPLSFDQDIRVSYMTKIFVSDILKKGECALPTLNQGFVAHRFILSALTPYFQKIFSLSEEKCPVT